MKLAIERASSARVDGFWKALDAVARERRYLLFTEAPPIERTKDFVLEVIEKEWSQFYAVDGDEVVGWCDVIPSDREGMGHVGHLGMGVVSSRRRQGIGGRLLIAAIEDAFSKGVERIELEVFASNSAAIGLYRSHGFEEEGRKRKARCLDGRYDDIVLMALFGQGAGE